MIKKCESCGKEFIDRTDNQNAKYCSKKCKHLTYNQLPSVNAYRKEWHEKNKERISLMHKKYYEENKEEILTKRNEGRRRIKEEFLEKYKRAKCCAYCGWKKHPEILQFHHKDRSKKEFTIGNIRPTGKYAELIKKEMEKCVLICPNCHALLHLKERQKKK